MSYQLEVLPEAQASINRMDKTFSLSVMRKLKWLSDNFESFKPHRLKGEYSEFFKLKLGDYRIFYTYEPRERVIFVHRIAHRSTAYKRK